MLGDGAVQRMNNRVFAVVSRKGLRYTDAVVLTTLTDYIALQSAVHRHVLLPVNHGEMALSLSPVSYTHLTLPTTAEV